MVIARQTNRQLRPLAPVCAGGRSRFPRCHTRFQPVDNLSCGVKRTTCRAKRTSVGCNSLRLDEDAYGNPIGVWSPSTALTSLLYSGEQTDAATGQQYLRARYYDPATGRFNRLDPFAGISADPLSLHTYLYVQADPIQGVDPSGEFFSAVGVGAANSIASFLGGLQADVGFSAFNAVEGALAGKSVEQTLLRSIAFTATSVGGGLLFGAALNFFSRGIPLGFRNLTHFSEFATDLNTGLRRAGVSDVQPILQGSAITGKSFRTGRPFDVGRVSDFDVALGSRALLRRAEGLGIKLRSNGTRTGPLRNADLQKLGLRGLKDEMSRQAGREVNFMIFESAEAALARSPGVLLPG